MNSDISLPNTIAWLKSNGNYPETLRYCEHALKLLNAESRSDPTAPEPIIAAFECVHGFIVQELECREASMLPASDTGDEGYSDSANAALRAANQLRLYLGLEGGNPKCRKLLMNA